jgi:RND superfamily putative drug exporter
MFEKIARFSVKFRWLIIVAWIVAIPVLTQNLPSINDVTKNDNTQFLPASSPTTQAALLEAVFQGKKTVGSSLVVAVRDSGPLSPGDNAAIGHIEAAVSHVPDVTLVQDQGVSADGRARQILVGLTGSAYGNQASWLAGNIRAQLRQGVPAGLHLYLTGQLGESVDAGKSNSSGRNSTEIYSVILILVLLLVVFRALLAPIVTLVPAALALAAAQPVIAESTKIGVQVSFITQILLIVLLLGAGTDYGLFLVFRVREELRRGLEPHQAIIKALSKVGESITFSAMTVAAALLSLVLAVFGLYKGLGPALAIGIGIMLLAALTFLPAVLAVLGRAVFWPAKTTKQQLRIGLWGKLAEKVIERPVYMLLLGVLIFGSLSLGIFGYRTTGFSNQNAPAGSESAIGRQVITAHFSAANNDPQLLIFTFNQPVWNRLEVIRQAQAGLAASGVFQAISGPFNANGFSLTPAELQYLHASGVASPAQKAVAQFISSDGRTVQFYTGLRAGPSGSAAAMAATPDVRAAVQKVGAAIGARQKAVYSNNAAAYDVNHTASNDLRRIIPVVLIIIAVLLAMMLRSLVAPWYLIATVGLSYFAALGFAMIVFVHFGSQDGLNFILPFLMFIFSMALGEDYNILVMSRIREETYKEKLLEPAVAKAIGITGTTVTSAGLILAGTFTVLGLVGGSRQVEQIGYSIAFGILLDTFFVRTLLVPSIVAMLGRHNWWPSKLYRISKN